nr:DUF4367 domain-containing protein [uncultured Oscillibacter sp.]
MSEARKDPAFGRAGARSEQIQGHQVPGEDLKERLQDELAELLLQPAEGDIDSDQLDRLLDALEKIDPAPEDGVPDTEESLKRFHERYADLFSKDEASPAGASEASPEKRRSHIATFKFALIAAVLVFMLGSVAAQAFGLNVSGAIARWTSEVFRFQSEEIPYATIRFQPLEEGEEASYDTLEEAVDAFGITAPIAPTWVPERFTLTGVTATNRSGGVLIYADYACDDEYFQIRYSETANGNFKVLEKEEAYMGIYTSGKICHYLMSDLGWQKVFWQNGELECQMFGSVSEQEIKDIIDSIY